MFYWSTSIPIHYCIVYDCFCTTVVEVSGDKDQCNAEPKILTMRTFSEKFCQSLAYINLKISILNIFCVLSKDVPNPAYLMRADYTYLFSPIYSVILCWQQEISHGQILYPIETTRDYKPEIFSAKNWFLKHLPAHHW